MPDRWGKYSYFDSPDGKDPEKKAWYISKNLAKLSLFSGTIDAFVITAPASKVGVLTVYAKHMGLLVGSGLAYVVGTYMACDLRKKDDQRNHVVGALTTSAIVGCAVKSPFAFAAMAVVSVPAVHVLKTFEMQGVRPFTMWQKTPQVLKAQPSLNWHITEIGSPKDSLRSRYEEKNEEYYRQLGSTSSEGTSV